MKKFDVTFCKCGRIHVREHNYDWLAKDWNKRSLVDVCTNCGITTHTFLTPYAEGEFTVNCIDLRDEFFEGFGVSVVRTHVTDTKPGNRSGAAGDTGFFGTYAPFNPKDEDGIDYGYEVHQVMSTSNSGLRPMFDASCLIRISPNLVNNLRTYPVIITSEDTTYVDESMKGKPGSVPVISVATYTRLINGETPSAKVFICGSTGFIDALGNNAVANTELFRCMLAATGNDTIIVNIEDKEFQDTTIIVDEGTVNLIVRYLVILLPAFVAVVGVVIYFVRKYWNGQ